MKAAAPEVDVLVAAVIEVAELAVAAAAAADVLELLLLSPSLLLEVEDVAIAMVDPAAMVMEDMVGIVVEATRLLLLSPSLVLEGSAAWMPITRAPRRRERAFLVYMVVMRRWTLWRCKVRLAETCVWVARSSGCGG